ncbi:DUF2182 domain-containing protein [Bradyrhizobium pachyrhizi]|uniref:copper chaperone n=1 Tax=Bradyrhizobium pachyrhizi TaxID=280333 RepID=UPI003D36FB4D
MRHRAGCGGVYQWSPFKDVGLARCQRSIGFLMRYRWLPPRFAGLPVHGPPTRCYCIGCCEALMALLFVGGLMNVL